MLRYLLLTILLLQLSRSFARTDSEIDGVYIDAEGTTGFVVTSLPPDENGKRLEVHHDIFETGVTVYRESTVAISLDKELYYRAPFESQPLILHFTTDKKGNKLLKTYHQGDLIGTYLLDTNHLVILSDIDFMNESEELTSDEWGDDMESLEVPPLYVSDEGAELYFETGENTIFSLYGAGNDVCPDNSLGDNLEVSVADPNVYVYKVEGCILLHFKVEADRITVTEKQCDNVHRAGCDSWNGVYLKQP